MRELENSGFLVDRRVQLVEPKAASIEELRLVHDGDYVEMIRQFCKCGGGMLDRDTVVCGESYEVARLAAGGALRAVKGVMSGEFRNGFAFVRPPGHHAGADYPMGFCVFNNVALAASYLLKKCGLSRVLILDVDAHHGNGTQDIFYNSNKVLYVSLHEDPIEFPLTGFVEEIGEGDGQGYSVNVPLPYGSDDKIYLKAFNQIVSPIINQYEPQFVLVSTGFDTHYSDPIGNLLTSSRSCNKIFDTALEVASKFCQQKFVAVLEGGYNLKFLGKLACSAVAKMAQIPYAVNDRQRGTPLKGRKKADKMITQAKKSQSQFWNLK
jgi:acetoin utilization deacetylase AcuC-like enzyme